MNDMSILYWIIAMGAGFVLGLIAFWLFLVWAWRNSGW